MTNKSQSLERAATSRVKSIDAPAVRRFIRTIPKTDRFKEHVKVLKKQLVAYESPDNRTALANLKNGIVRSVTKIQTMMLTKH